MDKQQGLKIRRLGYYAHSLYVLLRSLTLRGIIMLPQRRIELRTPNLSLQVNNVLDYLIVKETILDDVYQRNAVAVNSGDRIIVDIGAGLGDFAMMISQRFPRAHIYAFEPDPRYLALLKYNIRVNHVTNVSPIFYAVRTVSDIMRFTYKKRIDFLKVDCEGCEYNIFTPRTSFRYLKAINKVSLEYHDGPMGNHKDLASYFTKYGFKVHVHPTPGMSHLGYITAQ